MARTWPFEAPMMWRLIVKGWDTPSWQSAIFLCVYFVYLCDAATFSDFIEVRQVCSRFKAGMKRKLQSTFLPYCDVYPSEMVSRARKKCRVWLYFVHQEMQTHCLLIWVTGCWEEVIVPCSLQCTRHQRKDVVARGRGCIWIKDYERI